MVVAEYDMPIDGGFYPIIFMTEYDSFSMPRLGRPKHLHVVGGLGHETADTPRAANLIAGRTQTRPYDKDKLFSRFGKSSWDGIACGTGDKARISFPC